MGPYFAPSFEVALNQHQASVAVLLLTYLPVHFLMLALYSRMQNSAAFLEMPPYFAAYCNLHLEHDVVNFDPVAVRNLQEVKTMGQELFVEASTSQSSSHPFIIQILYEVFKSLNHY